jgi:hypothetical protein
MTPGEAGEISRLIDGFIKTLEAVELEAERSGTDEESP